jgi:hypothetical protein
MNKLSIKDTHDKLLDRTNNNDAHNRLDDYVNNYSYKVSLVNIDSRYRNKIPLNIIELNNTILPLNPITTTANSTLIKLNVPSHNYQVDDKIVIQNVEGFQIVLNNPIYLLPNFGYYIVKMKHGLLPQYTIDGNFKIIVSLYEPNDRLIGNIPINSITGVQSIYIYEPTDLSSFITFEVLNELMTQLNILQKDIQENYFFVKLPFNYTGLNSDIFNIQNIFQFKFLNIGRIQIPYLNANYPINYLQYQSIHIITSIDADNVYYYVSVNAMFSEIGGGNKVTIGKMTNTIEGYPNANQYTINLKRSFNDVVRMELVSTEIPYIDFNIINNVSVQNNKLYWQYLDDGDYIYKIEMPPGSYDPGSFIAALTKLMNSIERVGSTSSNIILCSFDITLNNNSQEVSFAAYKNQKLPYSLSLQNTSLGSVILTILQPSNFVNVGDIITISGATAMGDITTDTLNTVHTVYSVNSMTQTYSVLIPYNPQSTTINLSGNGGPNVTVRTPTYASFLFTYPDTLGSILGFKNTGSPNAITPFSAVITNFNNYILPTPYNEVGNPNTINNLLNLSGNYYYMLLYINDYEGIQTNTSLNNPFSKILMIGISGDVMFNTFVNSPLEFDIPISSVDEFNISFIFPDGSSPDFRNFEHSFTLRITERISQPDDTNINSKKMTYMDELIHLNTIY